MSEVTSLIDLNDSEFLKAEAVVKKLNDRQGSVLPLEGFRKEAIERFGEAGFRVNVRAYTTNQDGLYAFDIDIIDRLEGQFDPDQMVYEVTHDVLGLGDSGVIKSGPIIANQATSKKLWTPGSGEN